MSHYTRQDAYRAVFAVWGALIDGCPAYPANDDGGNVVAMPRPARPYVTIRVGSLPTAASGFSRAHDGTATGTYTGAVEFMTTLSVYGSGGLDLLGKLLDLLGLPSAASVLRSNGLGFLGKMSEPANRTTPLETKFEPRATVDLRWMAMRSLTVSEPPIEQVEVQTTLSRNGNTVLDETILTE